MKKSYKFIAVILLFMLTICLASTALADVIWEPDDKFYTSHMDECYHDGRSYYANSPDGNVNIYASPENGRVLQTISNGELLTLGFIYDESWGCSENGMFDGWIRLSDLALKYDSDSFFAEHSDEIESKDISGCKLSKVDSAATYTFPDSGEMKYGVIEYSDYAESGMVYNDGEGRQWLYVNYYMGMRDFWICADDPQNENIPADRDYSPKLYPSKEPKETDDNAIGIETEIIIGGAIALAAVATAITVLLIVFKKKTKK